MPESRMVSARQENFSLSSYNESTIIHKIVTTICVIVNHFSRLQAGKAVFADIGNLGGKSFLLTFP
jgi:hypothetical protein